MASNRESRPLDFLYDPTYIITSKERQKAEKNAQNLMRIKPLKLNNQLQSSSNLKDILTIQKTPPDHYSIDKPSNP
uniref:Uncharacterized protein n=1 Tax=Romanomermis culicivorax TaxID=13658 RepID=A0A915J8L5_ROMCU